MVLSFTKKSITRIVLLAAVLSCANALAANPPAGLSAPAKPTVMPAFDLPTVNGSTFRSESLRGQVVIVRYWASW